jgi:hypothetical protein
VERRISHIELNGVPVAGVLDKIEWLDGGKIRIVDFRNRNTGFFQNSSARCPESPWRILLATAGILSAAPESASIYPETVEKTAIIWLEPDKRGTFPVSELSVFSARSLTL